MSRASVPEGGYGPASPRARTNDEDDDVPGIAEGLSGRVALRFLALNDPAANVILNAPMSAKCASVASPHGQEGQVIRAVGVQVPEKVEKRPARPLRLQ